MKKRKGTAVLLLACFLAFAPPGTLILAAVLVLALANFVGGSWLTAGGVIAVVVLPAVILFLYKRSAGKSRP